MWDLSQSCEELSWVWDLLLLWFPSEHRRPQIPLAVSYHCLVLRVGLENFPSCGVSHPACPCHRVGLSPPPCGRLLLLVYTRFVLGEREGFPLSWSSFSLESHRALNLRIPPPCGSQTLPCICGVLVGDSCHSPSGRRPHFVILQAPRSRMGSCCSPKGKESFTHPSPRHSVPSCALELTGSAVPPSTQGFASWTEGSGSASGLFS